MNFSGNAAKTAGIFSNNAVLILKFSLIFLLVSILSLGIMMPALFAGLGLIFQKLDRKEEAGFGELFAYMGKSFRLFAIGLIIVLACAAGVVLIFIPIVILCLWMYSVLFMAYGGKGISSSLSASANAAVRNDFFGHLITALVLVILNLAGVSFFIVGLIVTVPLTAGFLAFSYAEIQDRV